MPNRQELLALAAQHAAANAVDLARRAVTPAALEAIRVELLAEMTKRRRWMGALGNVFVGSVAGAILLFAARTLSPGFGGAWGGIGLATLTILALWCSVAAFMVGSSDSEHREQRELLAPVVDSFLCRTALNLVKDGQPTVLAWRDLALAERTTLSGFDVAIMRALNYVATDERRKTDEQRLNEAASQQLYAVSSAARPPESVA